VLREITQTRNDIAPVFVRLMVGMVLLSERIQKFQLSALRCIGRFEKIGLPAPEILGTYPTLTTMLVAFASTKSAVLAKDVCWAMMHGSRTDLAMPIGSLSLLRFGSGKYAVDPFIHSKLS
jgi:putative oxidoreductase